MSDLREILAKLQGEYAETNRHIAMRMDSINKLYLELRHLRECAAKQADAMDKLRGVIGDDELLDLTEPK